jgi:signal peptidase II
VSRKRIALFWCVSAGLGAADVISKYLVFWLVPEPAAGEIHGSVLLPGLLFISRRMNKGFAWSTLDFLPPQLTAFINLIIIGVVIYYYFYSTDVRRNRLTFSAVVLVMAGALGNLFDRLVYGGVRDFIDVVIPVIGFDYPVFNLADIFVVVGVGLLILEAILQHWKEKQASGGP